MSDSNNELESMNRRNVLKSVAAGATLIGGMTSTSAAKMDSTSSSELEWSHAKRAAEAFLGDDDAIQRAFDDQAEGVREQLAAEGISMDFSTEEFDEMRTFPDHDEGTPTAHVVAEREDTTRKLELHVLPQADRAFAFLETESGRFKVEDGDLKPTVYCETSTYCDGYCQCSATQPCGTECDAGYEVTEECCTYSDGSTDCEIKDQTCTSNCPGKDPCS